MKLNMKRTLLSLVVLIASATVSLAQISGVEGKEKSVKATIDAIPDSLIYALPAYSAGRIVYNDGTYSNGLFNISNIDQAICYKDEQGRICALSNNNDVKYATIAGKMFFHYGGMFIQVNDVSADCELATAKQLTIQSDVKNGAFGAKSETTSIENYSGFVSSGLLYDLSSAITFPYKFKIIPYLYCNQKFYPVTKRNLIKFFPAKKGQIEAYIGEHRSNFEMYEQIAPFFAKVLTK